MNILQKIKDDLNSERNRRGMREQVVVNARALRELIRHYECMDSEARVEHNRGHTSVNLALHEALVAAYHQQGRDAETTLLVIMDTLRPLIEQRQKDSLMKARFNE